MTAGTISPDTNTPSTRLIAAVCIKASFGVVSIRSGMNAQEREKMVMDWNSPDVDLDVCILNVNISSAGLNLHGACSRGIIASFFWNMNTLIQSLGRLIRIGQLEPVEWRILKVVGTIFDWQELRMDDKVSTLQPTRRFTPEGTISNKFRTVVLRNHPPA